jgi:hypothetical protein
MKYGIKGFPVDPKTMNLEDGQLIEELMDRLKAGYNTNKPIAFRLVLMSISFIIMCS